MSSLLGVLSGRASKDHRRQTCQKTLRTRFAPCSFQGESGPGTSPSLSSLPDRSAALQQSACPLCIGKECSTFGGSRACPPLQFARRLSYPFRHVAFSPEEKPCEC